MGHKEPRWVTTDTEEAEARGEGQRSEEGPIPSPLSDEGRADEELESSLLTDGSIAGGDRKSPAINKNTQLSHAHTLTNPKARRSKGDANGTSVRPRHKHWSQHKRKKEPIDGPHGCLDASALTRDSRDERIHHKMEAVFIQQAHTRTHTHTKHVQQ